MIKTCVFLLHAYNIFFFIEWSSELPQGRLPTLDCSSLFTDFNSVRELGWRKKHDFLVGIDVEKGSFE